MVLEAVVEKLKQSFRREAEAPGTVNPSQLDDCLERVVHWLEGKYGKQFFVEPLEAFSTQFGKSFPEDPFYQDRMNYFLEHCVLERPVKGRELGFTPLRVFLDEAVASQPTLYPEPWTIFSDFRHSIFEVTRSGEKQIVLKDLLNERRYQILSKFGETLKFLEKRTVFQGYVFKDGSSYYLGQGMVTHPDRARKVLVRFIKQSLKSKSSDELHLLRVAAGNQMRYLRMKHVDPAKLYKQYLRAT